jgi:putative ATPase
LYTLLAANGVVSLAERIPRHTQRLYRLVDLSHLAEDVTAMVASAEEAIYADAGDPLVNWDVDDLVTLWKDAGFQVSAAVEAENSEMQVTAAMIERWFATAGSDRPTYAQRLAAYLSPEQVAKVRQAFDQQLTGEIVLWHSRTLFLVAENRPQ